MFGGSVQALSGEKSVAARIAEFGDAVRARLIGRFRQIGLNYPAKKMVLVGLKQERLLEVWVGDGSSIRFLKTYPILGASGTLGPKLREGDRQVPEGIYKIESLNPNSRFHLALRVGYPNDFDKEKAHRDGRTNLGSDIMIHGGTASVGCLAVGDKPAEDLFVLAAQTGIENVELILAPVDFRVAEIIRFRHSLAPGCNTRITSRLPFPLSLPSFPWLPFPPILCLRQQLRR